MKKALIVILIAALALTMAAILAGCGGDQNVDEAKQLMQKGDDLYNDAMTDLSNMEEAQGEIVASVMGGDLSSVTGEAGEAMMKQLNSDLSDMKTKLTEAESEYAGIGTMDGIEDYKGYAGLMILAITARQDQVDEIASLMTNFAKMLEEAAASGTQVDVMSLMESEEMIKLTELTEEAEGYEKEAESLKADKKL